MRIVGYELEAKKYKNLSIDLNDEYTYMDFYKYEKSNYNYIKRKYDSNYSKSGYYVGLYEDESIKRGYFYTRESVLLKDEHIYKKYTRYIELLEFGYNTNDLDGVTFFIDYLYYYSRMLGAKFLKVKTKEKDFEMFYELLRKFKHTNYKNYMYIKLDQIKPDNLRYLKKYKYDKLTLKELYHLNEIGYNLTKTKAILHLKDDQYVEIDRRTRKIKYPSMFLNVPSSSKYNYLNESSGALIRYVSTHIYDIKGNVEFNYVINGLEDYEFFKIGRKLFTLEKEKFIKDYQVKDEVKEIAKIICTETNISSIDIIMSYYFSWKNYYAALSSIWIYLEKYLTDEEENEDY